ncbi:MAG: LysM peptidoglycan-binding domain-containing protein [Clostridium sp.]|jgi:spore coat assembly protein SafA|nr:LysM peptidoglycan-binding domain-containing protein [Clostridium sp.]
MYYDPEFFCCQYCEEAMRQIPGFLRIYIVRPGDTLASIASRFNTTVAAIVRANNIQNPNLIFPGQRLIIPRMPMQPGPGFPRVYIVQSGDTLYSIANRFNVSMQRLIEVNRLEDPDVIYPGMRIIIPAQ